jgi:hypothetical protein
MIRFGSGSGSGDGTAATSSASKFKPGKAVISGEGTSLTKVSFEPSGSCLIISTTSSISSSATLGAKILSTEASSISGLGTAMFRAFLSSMDSATAVVPCPSVDELLAGSRTEDRGSKETMRLDPGPDDVSVRFKYVTLTPCCDSTTRETRVGEPLPVAAPFSAGAAFGVKSTGCLLFAACISTSGASNILFRPSTV